MKKGDTLSKGGTVPGLTGISEAARLKVLAAFNLALLLSGSLSLWAIPAHAQVSTVSGTGAPEPPDRNAPAGGAPAGAAPAGAAPPGGGAAPTPPPSFATVGPFSLSGTLTADVIGNPAGGIAPGLKLLTKSALVASFDSAASGHPGWTAIASLQYVRGGHISGANVGDVQGVDNIEAFNALRLYEAWVARALADGRAGVKVGITDLNVDFDTQQVAALFLNSSDGVGGELGHSGLNGPSIFPTTALALSGFYKPSDTWTLRAGLFDGLAGSTEHPGAFIAIHLSADAGALAIIQAEHTLAHGARAEGGAWAYTSAFDALHRMDGLGNPRRLRRERGAFALLEGPIATIGHKGGPAISGWVRAGLADPVVERLSAYVGTGVVLSGLIGTHPEDQAGISINDAIVDDPSAPLTQPGVRHAETAFELTYRAQLKDWLSVQPDMQLVFHPNGDVHVPTAVVVGLRLNIAVTHDSLHMVSARL